MLSKLFKWGPSGLKDWMWMRITAIVFLIYRTIIIVYWTRYPAATLLDWRALLLNPYMKGLGLVSLFCILLHSWLGLWCVITDYIKPDFMRKLSIFTVLFLIAIYLVSGIVILWGV